MRAGFVVRAALLIALSCARVAWAQATCSKADFEAVVDEAAGALRGLTWDLLHKYAAGRLKGLRSVFSDLPNGNPPLDHLHLSS